MEKICMQDELLNYNLEGKWNDYVGVQKELLNVLRKENFFAESEVTNVQTVKTAKDSNITQIKMDC